MGASRVVRRAGGSGNGDGDFDDDDVRTGPPPLPRPGSGDLAPSHQAGRDPLALSLHKLDELGLVSDVQPPRQHRGSVMQVESQLAVGVDQRIRITWSVPFNFYAEGYRLLGYRRERGFAGEHQRSDVDAHGTKIIEARTDGYKEEILPQGEYFYTFILYRKALLGCMELTRDVVQFSELIPGAKYAIERLQDTYDARRLIGKLLKQAENLRRLGGDRDGNVGRGGPLGGRSSREALNLAAQMHEEIDELKASPAWKKVTPNQRKKFIAAIREKYDRMLEGDEGRGGSRGC